MPATGINLNFDIVVAGAGQAGLQLVMSLIAENFSGSIALIGDEVALPYQRPPLSKRFLTDAMTAADLEIQPGDYYERHGITVLLGDAVAGLDRAARMLTLTSGRRVGYGRLVVATGARARLLPEDWCGLGNAHRIRSLDDAEALRTALQTTDDIAVVGGGFLGLEVAAAAAAQGKRVHVIEGADRLLARSASPSVSQTFCDLHRAHGSVVHLGARIASVETTADRVTALHLADGTRIVAGAVLIAIGVIPNVEVFAASGLAAENGLTVDRGLRTADPAIFAIGDCASYPRPEGFAEHLRVESVQNALDQAKHVAKALVGQNGNYDRTPVFWTEQFSTRLQVAGITTGATRTVLRGDMEARRYSTYLFRDGRLVAVESVNAPGDHMLARKLFARGLLPSEADLADAGFDPATLLLEPARVP